MDEIKIARLETLLYNLLVMIQPQFDSEDLFLAWLEKEVGIRKSEYTRIMKGASIW